MMNWKQLISVKHFGMGEFREEWRENRSGFQRDYDRLISSAPFRHLQSRTQVLSLPGSILVHNRLTHSLEIFCVGRPLDNDVAKAILERQPELESSFLPEIGSIVSVICPVHDLGNPPFGHSGERAVSTFFSEGKGQRLQERQPDGRQLSPMEWEDLTHFKGNANASRALTHQFEGHRRGGFVLTYSTLASIIKYPFLSSLAGKKSKFGFFVSEEESYRKIVTELGLVQLNEQLLKYARHPLVCLAETADDICYRMMGIEDVHRLKIITTDETKELLMAFFPEDRQSRLQSIFQIVNDINEQIVYLRSSVIGLLARECIRVFPEHEQEILAGTFEGALIKHIAEGSIAAYNHRTEMSLKRIYRSQDVLDIELAGFRTISTLLELIVDAVTSPGKEKAYSELLTNRVSDQYNIKPLVLYERIQAVLDYISGMTDVFALDLYRKINGNSLPAV